jgi:uncharacterized membrane protein YcaP (DUF421 family)
MAIGREELHMGWIEQVGGAIVSTAVAYLAVLFAVRLAGRRTVSQMSAFDVVITIALGSLLAQTTTSGTALLRGLVAIASLLMLQAGIGWLRRRSPRVEGVVGFEPRAVVRDGQIRHEALVGGIDGPQITDAELRAMLRRHGVASLDEVRVAILEPTGQLSALTTDRGTVPSLWTP